MKFTVNFTKNLMTKKKKKECR